MLKINIKIGQAAACAAELLPAAAHSLDDTHKVDGVCGAERLAIDLTAHFLVFYGDRRNIVDLCQQIIGTLRRKERTHYHAFVLDRCIYDKIGLVMHRLENIVFPFIACVKRLTAEAGHSANSICAVHDQITDFKHNLLLPMF